MNGNERLLERMERIIAFWDAPSTVLLWDVKEGFESVFVLCNDLDGQSRDKSVFCLSQTRLVAINRPH